MDEPKKYMYVPVVAVKNFIKGHYWLTSDFDELVDNYGIEVVHYKNKISISDEDASMFEGYSVLTVEEYAKQRAIAGFSEEAGKHVKWTGVEHDNFTKSTEYRFDIMIGEIPKRYQKGEKDDGQTGSNKSLEGSDSLWLGTSR